MPNPWFQFKQFIVHQDRCAMKVSTDACIQGAWAAARLIPPSGKTLKILDIGTGTGLLSLMLVQKVPEADLEAIDINQEALGQATENFAATTWKEQLKALPISLSVFSAQRKTAAEGYDFIICNPPFFHNQLQAASKARNDARHSIALSKEELAEAVVQLLGDKGRFCVMYPDREWEDWMKVAGTKGLYPEHILEVKPRAGSDSNRMIGIFSKEAFSPVIHDLLVIYETDQSYTAPFRQLLQPYYLAL